MAGYSGTPLPKKLGIGSGSRVSLINAPHDFHDQFLVPLPPGVEITDSEIGPFDVIVLFCSNRAILESSLPRIMSQMRASGGLWIAWPKKSSGIVTDLTETYIRPFGLDTGLVDNKICAINDIWSGLRFVVRVENRSTWPIL
jgi:hypothetical protein